MLLLVLGCAWIPEEDHQDRIGVCNEFGCVDQDEDGVGYPDDCDDGNPSLFPNNAEVCDGEDNDCDDLRDEGCELDPSGAWTLDARVVQACGGLADDFSFGRVTTEWNDPEFTFTFIQDGTEYELLGTLTDASFEAETSVVSGSCAYDWHVLASFTDPLDFVGVLAFEITSGCGVCEMDEADIVGRRE